MNFDKFKKIFKDREDKTKQSDTRGEEEIKLASEVYAKFLSSRNTKAPMVETWNKCIEAYNSEYFKNKDKPDYKSDEISNFIFSTVETIKPIMVDNDPKMIVLPKSPAGIDVVDKIQNAFDAEWMRTKMSKKLVQGITIALQIGTAVYMIPWDKKDDNGIGNVNPILINPYNIFQDPMATEVDNAEYIIYATYKHVNVLRQLYPGKASLLESGTINFEELVSQGSDVADVKNQVLVLECWMRDYTTIEYEEEQDGEKTKKRKMKYPRGRVVTVAPELQIVLEDKENPYSDGKFPFHLLKCYDVPFEFWGKGEIEQLLSPQTYINELVNQVVDNAKLTANMPWVIDKNSGIGRGQLTNRPGLIVRKNPGSDVKRLAPPPMPAYVQETIDMFKKDIEIVSGVHDITQGRKPGSISAASAIIALQEAAQARIRLKVKLMELTLGEMGTMWYARMQQFWVTTRWIRRSDMGEEMDAQALENGFVELTPEDLEINVDFTVVAGSTMPTNKNAMLDLMIRLAQTSAEDGLPMVDRETVLAYTNVPNKKKIMQKFEARVQQNQMDAENAQAQQIAQQEMLAEHSAQMEQTKNTNEQITDEQLNAVVEMLMAQPELLQQLMAQTNSAQAV